MSQNHLNFETTIKIIESFGLEYEEHGNHIKMNCPLHPSDSNSFVLYKSNSRWFCSTMHCEDRYRPPNLFGLVRGLLSQNSNNGKLYPYDKTIEFLKKEGVKHRPLNKDRKDTVEFLSRRKLARRPSFKAVENISDKLIVPSKYFISRGYSEKVLAEYGVGDYINDKGSFSPFTDRAIAPVHNSDGNLVGYTARSHATKPCLKCDEYHLKCGTNYKSPKWFHSPEMPTSLVLYNYHRARNYAQSKNEIILAEGPGDIWRLSESDINNAVCILGTKFSMWHQRLLYRLGVDKVTIMMDGDDAGKNAAELIERKLRNFFSIRIIQLPSGKDIGDLSVDKVKEIYYDG